MHRAEETFVVIGLTVRQIWRATVENSGGRRRFVVACDVRAQAEARKAAAPAHPRFPAAPSSTMLLLMPGAEITPDVAEEHVVKAPPPAQAQLSIAYGGRWLAFDNVQPHIAAELVRAAARTDVPPVVLGLADMPAAKESLRRFMEKRRHRLTALAPYSAPRQGKVKDVEAGC
jgi:jasmonate ZIM domain-containing protein